MNKEGNMKISKALFKSPLVTWSVGIYLLIEFLVVYVLRFFIDDYAPEVYGKLSVFLPSLEAVGYFSDYSVTRAIQYILLVFMALLAYPFLGVYDVIKNLDYFGTPQAVKWAKESSPLDQWKALLALWGITISFYPALSFFLFYGDTVAYMRAHPAAVPKIYVLHGSGIVAVIFQNIMVFALFLLAHCSVFYSYLVIKYRQKKGDKK